MKIMSVLTVCLLAIASCARADAAVDQAGSASVDAPTRVAQADHDNVMEAPSTTALTAAGVMKVFKTPTCGCCKGWVAHLEEAGFEVEVEDLNDLTPVKDRMGVPTELRSCHTAEIDGLVIEGHVPAETIRQVMADRGNLAGIAVPGMPIGSPGMEMPGRAADRYQVVGYAADGQRRVVAEH